MVGTILNITTVLIGGCVGLLLGERLPERLKSTVIFGMGLFTIAVGLKMFLVTKNPLYVLAGLLVGIILGEWWKLEDGLQVVGAFLEQKFNHRPGNAGNFVRGFLTSSLLFCVGPMTILGSIQDGLTGNYELLAIKAVLDGFAAMAFASTLGSGVLFSVIVILIYQGGISLLAAQLNDLFNETMMAEMTAAGGVILVGIAMSSLLEIRRIRMGNFLPALFITPLLVWLVEVLIKFSGR